VTPTFAGDSDNGGTGKLGDPKIITRIYRATDACGNSADYIQMITVEGTCEETDTSDHGTDTPETDEGGSEENGGGEESGGSEHGGGSEESGESGGCSGGNCP
jgi:hypothetical protein